MPPKDGTGAERAAAAAAPLRAGGRPARVRPFLPRGVHLEVAAGRPSLRLPELQDGVLPLAIEWPIGGVGVGN